MIDLTGFLDWAGDTNAAALAGLVAGGVFGVAAQRSRFCLRAAVVSFARGRLDDRVAVWLLCFATALVWTQGFDLLGWTSLSQSRMVSAPGSLSGAALGGLVFGAGMVLARGCSGRLLVLAAGGNLRALLAGLVFAVAAQASMDGLLAPLRQTLAGLWVTGSENIVLTAALGLPGWSGLAIGLAAATVALGVARRAGVSARTLWFGSGVGFAVGLGWLMTAQIAAQAFEPVGVESLTFSGPSADALMFMLTSGAALDFDIGLVAGVFLGAAAAARLTGEWRLEGFEGAASMRRYLVGAALMGFGAMLAGGCAIGAGVTGGSTFVATAWLALCGFWAGGAATDLLVDREWRPLGAAPATEA